MRTNGHGYVPAAVMFNRQINELRDHVEYEKFLCRTIVDNEKTREFKKKTEEHPNSVHRFIYNNSQVDAHTAAGRNKTDEQQES